MIFCICNTIYIFIINQINNIIQGVKKDGKILITFCEIVTKMFPVSCKHVIFKKKPTFLTHVVSVCGPWVTSRVQSKNNIKREARSCGKL